MYLSPRKTKNKFKLKLILNLVSLRYFISIVDKTVHPIPIGHRVTNGIVCAKG